MATKEKQEMVKAINALALELPEKVWNDFHYRWIQYQNSLPGEPFPEQGEMELLREKIEFYREQTDNVRQLVFNSKEIGEPCQPLYDAICDKINSQKSEIERLKYEIKQYKFNF